jgi:hypothetical protein
VGRRLPAWNTEFVTAGWGKGDPMMIKNEHGVAIHYEKAICLMDSDLRETIRKELGPCAEGKFFSEYCRRHRKQFHREFGPNTPDPEC